MNITLKDFMEVVDYRITEGSEYGWQCYGENAHRLDSWNGDNEEGYSVSVVFDTRTQVVYEIETCDYKNQRAYRLLNPEFRGAVNSEAESRNVENEVAWDEVNYTDLEVAEDFLEKTRKIVAGENYDTRVQIQLNLPDDELFKLMVIAHERDITLNELVCEVLESAIAKEKTDRG